MSCDNNALPVRGWLAGCAAATAVIYAPVIAFLVFAGGPNSIGSIAAGISALVFPTLIIFVITFVMSAIPAIVTIWLSERFRIRSIVFFGCVGALTAALSRGILLGPFGQGPAAVSWLFVGAGLAAGLTYWFVAGRYAGCDHHLRTDSI